VNPAQWQDREKRRKEYRTPEEQRAGRYGRYAVWCVGIGVLLLCLGLAIKALWSL
jgi:hypothetical protein